MRFAIYGVGGFGREVAPLTREFVASLPGDASVVFVDDDENRPTTCNNYPVIGFEDLTPQDRIVLAIGDGRVREKLDRRCTEAGLTVSGVAARTVRDLDLNDIGPGAVLCDNVVITANARIGRGFQANLYSYVAHDCVIGDYVTFAPRVSCNGNVHIESYAYIGTGAMLMQGKSGKPLVIGEGAIVGMGAVVTKSVPAGETWAGNPAMNIRELARRRSA